MRYHYLRFDIWLCLLLSVAISFIPAKIAEKMFSQNYDNYVEEHTVENGEIGGKAEEDVYRAQNVEDLLSHETFTIVSPGIQYSNRGAGFHGSYYMYAVTLPSGERVAACINMDNVQRTGESIYSGDSILPVGHIVYENLAEDEYFINQIEHSEELTRKDFYIDMLGKGGKVSKENYTETPKTMVQVITVIVLFPIFHSLGAKMGIFPYFFAPKKKTKSEWE